MSDHIRFINPERIPASTNYTHVVETTGTRTIYISGQVPLDEHGNLVGENDAGAQTAQVLENIGIALAAVGATFEDIVKMTTYIVDGADVQAVRDARRRYITAPNPPAHTAVPVIRLFRPDFLVEIEAIAVLP
jgi:enamine deaminase RidA (YjgF/YER057c/UK114 family)